MPKVQATYWGGGGGGGELFPEFLERKNQFPNQGWNSFKFSLNSK